MGDVTEPQAGEQREEVRPDGVTDAEWGAYKVWAAQPRKMRPGAFLGGYRAGLSDGRAEKRKART